MTNHEMLKSLSVDEMAEFIAGCKFNGYPGVGFETWVESEKRWLMQEAKRPKSAEREATK